jgi:hypothetical protein
MEAPPTHCDIRPDALVMACATDRGIALLELPSGALLRILRLSDPRRRRVRVRVRVRNIAFSPRGNTLVVQTGRQSLVAYNFDHPGKAIRYTGIDALVRVRLGLPIVAPKITVRPGRVTAPSLLKPKKPLRHDRFRPAPRRR